MNDGLSDDIKKKFTLPLTIELHDHIKKVFHNSPVSLSAEHGTGRKVRFTNKENVRKHRIIRKCLQISHKDIQVISLRM